MPILAGTPQTGTTLADLIAETQRHLTNYQRPPMNRLSEGVTAEATTLALEFETGNLQAGHLVEIDLELIYVWSVDRASKTATVERAQAGSRAASHAAAAVVKLNPKFPDFAIAKAINDDLRDLSSPVNGLYAVRTLELLATANSIGYDLADAEGFMEVLDVRTKHIGYARDWQTLTNYQIDSQVSSTDFPSGTALTLYDGVMPGQGIRVLYKSSFSPLTLLTDNVEEVAGLSPTMLDLPPMGAAIKLVVTRDIRRSFYEEQGDSRRAEEVPPGSATSALRGIAGERARRITAEASRLAQLYPERTYIPMPGLW